MVTRVKADSPLGVTLLTLSNLLADAPASSQSHLPQLHLAHPAFFGLFTGLWKVIKLRIIIRRRSLSPCHGQLIFHISVTVRRQVDYLSVCICRQVYDLRLMIQAGPPAIESPQPIAIGAHS